MKKNMSYIIGAVFLSPFDGPEELFNKPVGDQPIESFDPILSDPALNPTFDNIASATPTPAPLEANIPASVSSSPFAESEQPNTAGNVFEALRNMDERNSSPGINNSDNMHSVSTAQTFARGDYDRIRDALAHGGDLTTTPDGSTAFGNQSVPSSIGNGNNPESIRSQGNMNSVSSGKVFACNLYKGVCCNMKKNMNTIIEATFASPFDGPAEGFNTSAGDQPFEPFDPYLSAPALDPMPDTTSETPMPLPLETNIPASISPSSAAEPDSAARNVFDSLRNMGEGDTAPGENNSDNMQSISTAQTFAGGDYDRIRDALAHGGDFPTNPDGSPAFGNQSGPSSIGNGNIPESVRSQGNMESVSSGHTFAGRPDNVFHPAEEPSVLPPAYESTRTNLIHIAENDEVNLPASSLQEGGNSESISGGHVFA